MSSEVPLNTHTSPSGAQQLALCASVIRDIITSEKDRGEGTAKVAEAEEIHL